MAGHGSHPVAKQPMRRMTVEAQDKKHGMSPAEILRVLEGIDERAKVSARVGWHGQLTALTVQQPMDPATP